MPHPKKKRRIIPTVREISLAYNPKNRQEFLMRKDDNIELEEIDEKLLRILRKSKGGNSMNKLLELLNNVELLKDEEAFDKELSVIVKDEALTPEDVALIKSTQALILSAGDKLSDTFVEDLTKALDAAKGSKVDVDKIKEDLRKEIEAEFSKDKEIKIAELMKANEDMKKALEETAKMAEQEREIRRTAELKQFVKDNNIPGDAEKVVKILLDAEKTDKELYDNLVESYTAIGKAVSPFFQEHGTSAGTNEATEAEDRLNKLVQEAMKKDSDLTYKDALRIVGKENPELWNKYRQGRNV